jgi:ABC-type glycerol-3-phosphate transport system permease component
MNQKTKRISVVKIIIYLFFVLMTALYLVPLLWVFSVSFKTNAEIFFIAVLITEESIRRQLCGSMDGRQIGNRYLELLPGMCDYLAA